MSIYETYFYVTAFNMFQIDTIVSISNMLYSYVGVIEVVVHVMKDRGR